MCLDCCSVLDSRFITILRGAWIIWCVSHRVWCAKSGGTLRFSRFSYCCFLGCVWKGRTQVRLSPWTFDWVHQCCFSPRLCWWSYLGIVLIRCLLLLQRHVLAQTSTVFVAFWSCRIWVLSGVEEVRSLVSKASEAGLADTDRKVKASWWFSTIDAHLSRSCTDSKLSKVNCTTLHRRCTASVHRRCQYSAEHFCTIQIILID